MVKRVDFSNNPIFGGWRVSGRVSWSPNVQGGQVYLRNAKNPSLDTSLRVKKVDWKLVAPNFAEVVITKDDNNILKVAGFFDYDSAVVSGVLFEQEMIADPAVLALKINGLDIEPVENPAN